MPQLFSNQILNPHANFNQTRQLSHICPQTRSFIGRYRFSFEINKIVVKSSLARFGLIKYAPIGGLVAQTRLGRLMN